MIKDISLMDKVGNISLFSEEDFKKMRVAGLVAAGILDYITDFVKEGVSTEELDKLCHDKIVKQGAIPAPLNYKGYPKSICTSINHVICHGIPSKKDILKKGDILNIDVTTIVDGWYGDTSRMFFVGKPSVKTERLVKVTYDAMMLGIEQVKPGNRLGDIGEAIQSHVESYNYSVVRDYCGHGIGRVFHTNPNVLHYGKKGKGLMLEEGMFFTIEPMVNIGHYDTILHQSDRKDEYGNLVKGYGKKDDWTVTTKDRSLSAQFEHTIGVTSRGYEIFTLSTINYHKPPYV